MKLCYLMFKIIIVSEGSHVSEYRSNTLLPDLMVITLAK